MTERQLLPVRNASPITGFPERRPAFPAGVVTSLVHGARRDGTGALNYSVVRLRLQKRFRR